MAAHVPSYRNGPVPYEVNVAVTGGQLVEPDAATGRIKPTGAASLIALGVAREDGIPVTTDQNPVGSVNLSPLPSKISVDAEGYHRLQYAATATFGQKLQTATNGRVTPWVAAGDPRLIVGYCAEPGGATVVDQKYLTKLTL